MKKFWNVVANAIYLLALFALCFIIFNLGLTAWIQQNGPSMHNVLICAFFIFLFIAAVNLIRIAWKTLKRARNSEEKRAGYNAIGIVIILTLAIGYFCYLKLL